VTQQKIERAVVGPNAAFEKFGAKFHILFGSTCVTAILLIVFFSPTFFEMAQRNFAYLGPCNIDFCFKLQCRKWMTESNWDYG